MKKHIFFWKLLRPPVSLFLKIRFGYRYQRPKALPKQYIVLSNHVTDWDPLLVSVAFRRQMYLVGSEHIARWKHAYKFIKFIFDPIMRPKGASAMAAVMSILRRIKKGANICFFPEGVRSWDGRPCPILPSTAKLVKKAGVGLVTFRITGGYFVSPMWSASLRRGKLRGQSVGVYSAEEIAAMSEEELYGIILRDLGEDAYLTQEKDPQPYRTGRGAEHLEHYLWHCPVCGESGTLSSEKDRLCCAACGQDWRFDRFGYLSDGEKRMSVAALAEAERERIARDAERGVCYRVAGATVFTVAEHKEKMLSHGELLMDGEFIRCGEVCVAMKDITEFAMHGKFALVFSAGREYYEIVPDQNENMIKFMMYFNAYSNVKVG